MKKYIFNLLLLFCCTCSVYAQNSSVEVQTNRIEVEGLVTDESKEPLIGVNVIIKDIPGLGAITDIDGKFKIKMEPYHRLVFSFIGFEKQEVLIKEQRTISSFDKNAATKTYSLPVTASWQVDLFGQLLNSKRNAQVTLKQTKAYRQAVQTQVISNIANMYYTLMMLDRQLEITKSTAEILKKNAETMEAMKDAAMYNINSTGVEQSKAAYAQVLASIPDIEQSIRETENALSTFLGEAPHAIKRGTLEAQVLPTELSAGVPIQLLSNRPDVKAAEMALASCYYNTNSARAAFYPQITLSGSAGWTNSAGSAIINPGKLLASAVGSLTQPLFYRGQNIARLKAAKAQEESAKLSFQQALLNAGSEVSNALSLYQKTSEKVESRRLQVESAKKASEDTKELFNLGTSTYLEVLSAQQSYLSAQISQVSDCFDQMQAVVSLYQALGGGREE